MFAYLVKVLKSACEYNAADIISRQHFQNKIYCGTKVKKKINPEVSMTFPLQPMYLIIHTYSKYYNSYHASSFENS